MPVFPVEGETQITANVTIVTTTEKAIVSSPKINVDNPAARFIIIAYVVISASANSTTATVQLRQGSGITGTSVASTGAIPVTASVLSTPLCIMAIDQPGAVADWQYTLTVTMAGASANSTANPAAIAVLVQ